MTLTSKECVTLWCFLFCCCCIIICSPLSGNTAVFAMFHLLQSFIFSDQKCLCIYVFVYLTDTIHGKPYQKIIGRKELRQFSKNKHVWYYFKNVFTLFFLINQQKNKKKKFLATSYLRLFSFHFFGHLYSKEQTPVSICIVFFRCLCYSAPFICY